MTEAFLHYIWKYQMFSGELATTDGQPVVVLRAGDLNHDSGPDFFNARIRIGGVEWAGNVEIHIHSSDWSIHRHQQDAAYNNVVLHVVYEYDTDILMQNGRRPPVVELKSRLHPSLVSNYEALTAPASGNNIPCSDRVGKLPSFFVTSYLERLVVERIEDKAATVRRLLKESHGKWDTACYWLIAHYFGGKVNSLPFELVAKATDQRLLARWSDNRQRVEALLMGQAGLLSGYFKDEYPRQLQADYDVIRVGAGLTPVDESLWKFFRIRPSAFPTIRISQFSDLVCQSNMLFSILLDTSEVHDLESVFNRPAAAYWNTHYRFDQPSDIECVKRVGRMQADLLIINAVVPLLFVYGVEQQQEKYKEQALNLLSQLQAENNSIVRRWQEAGLKPANAGESQALLQLYNNYCTSRRCLECHIGYQLLKRV